MVNDLVVLTPENAQEFLEANGYVLDKDHGNYKIMVKVDENWIMIPMRRDFVDFDQRWYELLENVRLDKEVWSKIYHIKSTQEVQEELDRLTSESVWLPGDINEKGARVRALQWVLGIPYSNND